MVIDNYYKKTKSGDEIDGFKPFKYQKEVAEAILNGENIILQAPTGAGKTLASIMPFIIANEEDMNFPKKLIYSTPRRTLVNSLYEDIEKEIDKGKFKQNYNVTIQTGEKKEDRYFNGDIIFTTFDQSLSSALSMPISLSNRLGNINVGAVLSSYLIFDEFHLFDLEESYTTTVLMLEKLKDKVPFCIMTATISEEKINHVAKKLNAKVIRADSQEHLADIVTQQGKERVIYTKEKSINAEEVVQLHTQIKSSNKEDKSKKSIVMCNRVENAQQIYQHIKELVKEDEIKVLLIHSRFLDEDRKEKEEKIKEYFSKRNKDSNVILVSTQVIEVGIDITSHIMHTEISSIDSFLQRIGRCARYQNEKGKVYVYDVLNEGDKKYLPYNEEVTLRTFEALREIDRQVLTSEISQKVIDRVYTQETDIDAKDNEKVDNTMNDFIIDSWKNPAKDNFKDLIRNVIGCNIVIQKWIPDKLSPYNYHSLGISPWTLRKKVKELVEETDDWLVKEVIERDDDSDIKYTYREITAKDIYPNTLYILNPDYFGYNSETGLVFDGTGKSFDPLPKSNQEPYDNEYKEESYLEHIQRMKEEIPKLEEEMSYAIALIKDKFELTDYDFRDIVEFTIWAHDLGKLQEDWQLAHKVEGDELIAHAERIKKPPSHAGESFWIVFNLLEAFILDYLQKDEFTIDIIAKSIVSHHSLTVSETGEFKISKNAIEYLTIINKDYFIEEDLTNFINSNNNELYLVQKFKEDISDEIRIRNVSQYLFYFVLVRILRLSDQRATKKLNEGS
ncbi:CRISPR-associated helicase Cas3' [Selenihalanaerobacter shriftii]|uniref:CRISPR-associated endonuclease/helicase Cas3 n=1 Tax=Selenihalanaerobacter shriftii TaxID=142842 RepID=A0A1T4PHF1_9FIRM|nr:CRISPR-associated helicase Cas3' [Selenihalanaerobacter shriftii]SJZ90980.1 CRISPR-associated endonuclease/helicase Cas3 [Selenihalanaerobacter shriftii]